jgi:hypothetical protein
VIPTIPTWALKLIGVGLLLLLLQGYRMEHARASAAQAQVTQLNADIVRRTKHAEATQEVLSARADSKARIVTITKEIVREVPVLVPAGTPALPGGWRVLHDAAAAGEPADPASGADAASVGADEAAETVVENYGLCRDTRDQLLKLQQWVRGVSE